MDHALSIPLSIAPNGRDLSTMTTLSSALSLRKKQHPISYGFRRRMRHLHGDGVQTLPLHRDCSVKATRARVCDAANTRHTINAWSPV